MRDKSEMAKSTPLARSGGKVASHRGKHPSAYPTAPGLSFPPRGLTPTEVVAALALSLGGKLRTAVGSWIIYETGEGVMEPSAGPGHQELRRE